MAPKFTRIAEQISGNFAAKKTPGFDFTRREFCSAAASALAGLTVAQACAMGAGWQDAGAARLTARPKAGVATTATGSRKLGLDTGRDAILQMPANPGTAPLPLLVLLHGASGTAERQLARFGSIPSNAGIVILAPDSRGQTWDAIRPVGFGPDVSFINRALTRVFELVTIDPGRITIGGFSDGATYALSLGLLNGDLFSRILAFSPGFVVNGPPNGKPRVFVSHGTRDDVLPIDRCGRVIAAQLKRGGYDVTYREFDGGHEVPTAIATEGMKWAARV